MSNITIQEFVNAHVHYEATMLIYNLHQEGKLNEEYWSLLTSIDWDSAEKEINGTDNHIVEINSKWDLQRNKDEYIYYTADTKYDLIRYYYHHDMSELEVEVLEWWIVSDYLFDKLKAKGETVEQFYGLPIWGRTCSGQAIYCDYVIQEIYNDLINQRND